jgi:hypothetical protein
VGLDRIELSTSALSVLRSNRLSYSPSRSAQRTGGPLAAATDQTGRAQPPGSIGFSSSTVISIPPTTSLMRL